MQEAIKRAKEAGYKNADSYIGENDPDVSNYLLDPEFWKALGKSEGWTNNLWIGEMSKLRPDGYLEKEKWELSYWEYNWHKLIDALSEGKDIDSFFISILK